MKIGRRQFCFLISDFCFLASVFCNSQAQAADFGNSGKGPVHKLSRGFAHIIAAPFQIPKEIIQTTAETKPHYFAPFRGMTVGLGSGAYQMGRQVVAGFADLFTFWSPRGRDWQPIYEPASLLPEM